jgi:ABC-type multidrug transport system fused ATPase/permease subunit
MTPETLPLATEPNRFVRARNLMWSMVGFHKGYFFTAVAGAAVFAIATVLSSYGVKLLIDDVILPTFETGRIDTGTWLATSLIVVFIGLVRAAGVVVRRSFAGRASSTTAKTIANKVLRHLMQQPPSWHRSRMTGDVAARASVDTDAATQILNPMPFSSSVIVLLVVAGAWLIATDTWLGLFAFLVFPVMLVTNVLYQRRVDGFYRTAQDELGALSEAAHESFDGVLVVKAFGAEERETERLAAISRRLRHARTTAIGLRSTFESIIDATPSLVNIAIIALGAIRVRDGAMTIGELSAFVFLFTLVSLPLRIVSFLFSELPHSASGWDRVRAVLDEPLQPSPRAQMSRSDHFAVELVEVSSSHVAGKSTLRAVNLRVPRGRTTAVVGATGSGKTTLLHVIAGLVPVDAGEVRLGVARVGLVFQEAFLFAESLRYNLTLGADVPESDIFRALRVAAADQFVADLGVGLDTELGERGVSLSGGQRQRLALARALATGSELLLLDDTTSALDPATEATVLTNLRSLHDTMSTIIVASRPSTIALADDVAFMIDGRVVAVGAHEELIARNSDYQSLISAFEHDRESNDAH